MSFPQFVFNNVRRNARAYIAYFLSSTFMVMVFFAYSVFIYHPGIANNELGPTATMSMQISAYIVYVFAFFFVLCSIGSFLKSRNLEFGIVSVLCARPNQIIKLIFLENMLIGIVAIVTGIAGGMLLSELFLLFSTKMMGIGGFPFYWPIKAMLVTSFSFVSLFLAISIFTLLFIRKNKVLDLLQGNVKPRKQPKVSLFLSLLGAVLLAIGFYALRMELSPFAIVLAAAAGVTGTYFFYSQLSVFFLRLIQRSRRPTWRGTRLLWISRMSYNLRDNSRMLFLITVVTALASMGAGVVLSINQAGKELAPLVEQPAVSLYVKESVTTESIEFISSIIPVLNVPETWMEMIRVAESAEEGKSEEMLDLTSRAANYWLLKQSTAMLSFVSIFVALIFSIASASFLYFKLHSELSADIRTYRALFKMGISPDEMWASATKQIAILFYIPIVVAAIQSLVVIGPILQMGIMDVLKPVLITFSAYLILQSVLFIIVKSRYIRSVRKMMV